MKKRQFREKIKFYETRLEAFHFHFTLNQGVTVNS